MLALPARANDAVRAYCDNWAAEVAFYVMTAMQNGKSAAQLKQEAQALGAPTRAVTLRLIDIVANQDAEGEKIIMEDLVQACTVEAMDQLKQKNSL